MIHPYSYRWLLTFWVLAAIIGLFELARALS